MEFKVVVISTFHIYDNVSKTFTTKVHHEVFKCMNEALEYISTFDYPPKKISIHLLTH